MTEQRKYTVGINSSTRRAFAEQLPLDVAMAVADFVDGPLAKNPRWVGKELNAPYEGVYSARDGGMATAVHHR